MISRLASSIKAIKKVPDNLPLVMADESEIVQAFTNLFRNAMQSIDEKRERSGVIETEVTVGDSDLEIKIRDNGTGIPEEAQQSIFNFDFSTKSKNEGTGLGLGISRRFVRESGGDLILERSVNGEGTTFGMTLPFLKEDTAPEL